MSQYPYRNNLWARKRRFSDVVIDIDPEVVKTWLRIASNSRVPKEQLLLNASCMFIDLSRKGTEYIFVSYKAFSTDNEGSVSFYWDDVFLNQEPGMYFGDVYINDTYCFTVQFRIRRCEAGVIDSRNEYEPLYRLGNEDIIGTAGMPTRHEDIPCIPQDVIETGLAIPVPCSLLPVDDCAGGTSGGIGYGSVGPDSIGVEDE